MGLGPGAIRLNLELEQRGFFKNINSVIEMGSQELQLKQIDFEELVLSASIAEYKKETFANLTNWPDHPRCSTKPFYQILGVNDYSCIDLGKQHGAIPHDLNLPFEDSSLYGQYDLVTDYGTNEHVFNTVEAYRTMHRLCKKNGYMIILQAVYRGNRFYTYDVPFFEGIAAANNYKILYASYSILSRIPTSTGSPNEFFVPLAKDFFEVIDLTKVENVGICYVMQKQSGSDFQIPYEGQYLAKASNLYGYQLHFLPNPPSREYAPLNTIDFIPTKSLLRVLSQRLKRKIKAKLKVR